MYIIHEQQLVHVDRGSDILEHYGVKGMHWGTKIMNKKTRERLDGRANKRKEYLKKKKTGVKASLYKGLNGLNNIDKKVSKSFDNTIGYKNNGNVKEMTRYENSKYDSTKSKRKYNYSRSL